MLAKREGKRALEFLDCLLREGEQPAANARAITWMYPKLIEASELKGIATATSRARTGMRPQQPN